MRDARKVAIRIAERNIGLLQEQITQAKAEIDAAKALIEEKTLLIEGLSKAVQEQARELADFVNEPEGE